MSDSSISGRRFSGFQLSIIMMMVIILTVLITSWIFVEDIFSTRIEPVTLSVQEQQVLTQKLDAIGAGSVPNRDASQLQLVPEPYSELDENREISFTEKELNGLLSNNTDLASKLAIDLSDNLMSVKLLLPMDKEMPVIGGKTLKVTAGIELLYRDNRPVVVVKGISVWGVPVPQAYLGNIKNIDIIKEFGDAGFWKSFADGMDDLRVEEGSIVIKLNN